MNVDILLDFRKKHLLKLALVIGTASAAWHIPWLIVRVMLHGG
jgi:hypothetical protein